MRRFLFFIVICIFLNALPACSGNTESPSIIVNDLGEYHNILNGVLQNQKTFITGKDTAVYLKNYQPEHTTDEKETPVDPYEYAFVDLDGDAVDEMVVNISEATGIYLILHYNGHDVFGYETSARSLSSIKTDGSFLESDGADSTYFCRLSFAGRKLNITKEAIMDTAEGLFQIDGKNVSESEVLNFSENWHKKQDISWTALKDPDETIQTTSPAIEETTEATVPPDTRPSQDTPPSGTISLNAYVTVEFYGYNKAGMATVRFDQAKFLAEQAEQIRFKSESAKTEYINATGDTSTPAEVLCSLVKNVTLSADEGLCNGDVVSLQWKVSTSKIEKYFSVAVSYKTQNYTVSQLTIPEEFNPFDYINVTYTGTAPCGKIQITVDTTKIPNSWLGDKILTACTPKDFTCSPEVITQPGQEVRISYSAVDTEDSKSLIKYIDTYGLIPTKTLNTYKLSGFDYYPEGYSQIDTSILKEADQYCRSILSAKARLQLRNINRMKAYYVKPEISTNEGDRSLYVVYKVDAAAEFLNLDNAPTIQKDITFYYVIEMCSVKILANGGTAYANISTTINPVNQNESVYFTYWEVGGQITDTLPDAAADGVIQHFYYADGFANSADAERVIRNRGGKIETISY